MPSDDSKKSYRQIIAEMDVRFYLEEDEEAAIAECKRAFKEYEKEWQQYVDEYQDVDKDMF